MSASLLGEAALASFRKALCTLYGDRLDRVILFGSRARGKARPEPDYDAAVFLRDLPDRWAEIDRLAWLRVGMLDEAARFSMWYLMRRRPTRTGPR